MAVGVGVGEVGTDNVGSWGRRTLLQIFRDVVSHQMWSVRGRCWCLRLGDWTSGAKESRWQVRQGGRNDVTMSFT